VIIENIIICILVAFLIYTSERRNYLGFLVLGYYAIFICIDIKHFGFDEGIYNEVVNNSYEYACLMLCIATSSIASYLFYKGSNLAGLYSGWLIFNATLCFIGVIFGYSDYTFYFVYNLVQNSNLIIDLFVVIIGTDNMLHRTKSFGNLIDRINTRVDKLFSNHTNNRIQA